MRVPEAVLLLIGSLGLSGCVASSQSPPVRWTTGFWFWAAVRSTPRTQAKRWMCSSLRWGPYVRIATAGRRRSPRRGGLPTDDGRTRCRPRGTTGWSTDTSGKACLAIRGYITRRGDLPLAGRGARTEPSRGGNTARHRQPDIPPATLCRVSERGAREPTRGVRNFNHRAAGLVPQRDGDQRRHQAGGRVRSPVLRYRRSGRLLQGKRDRRPH